MASYSLIAHVKSDISSGRPPIINPSMMPTSPVKTLFSELAIQVDDILKQKDDI